MATRKYIQRRTILEIQEDIIVIEKSILNKYPSAQGKLVWDILASKIDIKQSIAKKQLDEQLAATIRKEYPQHVKLGT